MRRLAGYEGLFTRGIAEIGCRTHGRRKFFELHAANKSTVAEQALALIGQPYDTEREGKALEAGERLARRQARTKPVLGALQQWMALARQKVPDNSATAKALDYSLKRWAALVRFSEDGQVPIDNDWIEDQIQPIALGSSRQHQSLNTTLNRPGGPAPGLVDRLQPQAEARSNASGPLQLR